MVRVTRIVVPSVIACLLCRTARAQDIASAHALFDWGVDLMESGQYDVGCPALAESQRLDPKPGTLAALADCYDRAGKIASAVAMYDEYLHAVTQMPPDQKVRHQRRSIRAASRRAALLPDVPSLTLTLSEAAPDGLRITRDGKELTTASLGVPLPVDPGRHILTTRVGDAEEVEQRIVLARAERVTLELRIKLPEPQPAPARTPEAPAPQAPPPPVVIAPPASPAVDPHPRRPTIDTVAVTVPAPGMSGRDFAAIFALGVGSAGLALGGISGLIVAQKKAVVLENCVGTVCNAEGKAAADSAVLPAMVSNIGFGVGAAGVGLGLMLLLADVPRSTTTVEKKRAQARVDFDGGRAMLTVKGVW